MTKLTFYGAAKVVTGSNYLLEEINDQGKVTSRVVIDCGLQQGVNYCESDNFDSFPYDPKTVDGVILTHAHIDHTGRVPKLVREGFTGSIYSTPPTKDFAEHLLIDSINILNQEAEKHGCPEMYQIEDIDKAMDLWLKIPYHEKQTIGDFEFELFDAGHILGSSSVLVTTKSGKRIVFSGDLGNTPAPLLRNTEYFDRADYALMESTYGNRVHEDETSKDQILRQTIEDTIRDKGTLLIPAFAMERTQELLYAINDMVENNRIPRVPVFLDSPLAIKLTAIYTKYSENAAYFDKEALQHLQRGDALFNFPGLKMTLTSEQSKEINEVDPPKVILAGAGMMNGGRVLHHAARYLQDPHSTLLFVGYQAHHTLGREILEGAKQVKIFDWDIDVRCHIKEIGGYSAHADQPKLLEWLRPMKDSLQNVFLIHGEEDQMTALQTKIKEELGIDAEIPSIGDSVTL